MHTSLTCPVRSVRRWAVALSCFVATAPAVAENWPQFRGVQALGMSEGKPVPTEWDVESGKNILWKSAIPGLGLSSPIVWEDKVFVTTAINEEGEAELKVGLYGNIAPAKDDGPHKWVVMCLDRKTGKELWRDVAHEGKPAVKRHTKASHANSTPATDGKRVVAFFGSEGLHCYDMDGKKLWSKDFGVLDAGFFMVPAAQWEFGSSPILHDDKVIVICDVQKDSFIAALDADTGEVLWKTPREDVPTWNTPAVHVGSERTQIIANGWKHLGGYNLKDGSEVWKLDGLQGGDIPVPTPIIGHDLIYLTSAHGPGAPVYAIQTTAAGELTAHDADTKSDEIVWYNNRIGNYMQTPILMGDRLVLCRDNGVMTVLNAKTGEIIVRHRLGDGSTGFTASPVANDGKLFYTAEDGGVHVVRVGQQIEKVAVNEMGESCMATPAIADGVLFVRGAKHLFAIGEK